MRFLHRNKSKKTILVISDLHLGAGAHVNGHYNFLEDFHFDQELVDFLHYFSQAEYLSHDVHLIINGDFLDFLAVPFVEYFDDEYWSEPASLERLKIILKAHTEVIQAMKSFLSKKDKKITYIIGNHDAELVLPKVRSFLIESIGSFDGRFTILDSQDEFEPYPGILVKHGHQYEEAHNFSLKDSVISTATGELYFKPPWGSYYVTRVVNKFKEERSFINQVRPIRTFLIYGLIFDTLFTIRFMLSNFYYFFMVRFLYLFKQEGKIREVFEKTFKELELFQDYESLTRSLFDQRPDLKVLVVGHNHEPAFKVHADGATFINTGTWTKMFNLDFAKKQDGFRLTFAQLEVTKSEEVESTLNEWKGVNSGPYSEFQ